VLETLHNSSLLSASLFNFSLFIKIKNWWYFEIGEFCLVASQGKF
jgi:hypothetical protein